MKTVIKFLCIIWEIMIAGIVLVIVVNLIIRIVKTYIKRMNLQRKKEKISAKKFRANIITERPIEQKIEGKPIDQVVQEQLKEKQEESGKNKILGNNKSLSDTMIKNESNGNELTESKTSEINVKGLKGKYTLDPKAGTDADYLEPMFAKVNGELKQVTRIEDNDVCIIDGKNESIYSLPSYRKWLSHKYEIKNDKLYDGNGLTESEMNKFKGAVESLSKYASEKLAGLHAVLEMESLIFFGKMDKFKDEIDRLIESEWDKVYEKSVDLMFGECDIIKREINIWHCASLQKYVTLDNGAIYYKPNSEQYKDHSSIDYWVRYVKGKNDAPEIKDCNGNEKLLRNIRVYVNGLMIPNNYALKELVVPTKETFFNVDSLISGGFNIWHCSYPRKYVDLDKGEPYYIPHAKQLKTCCLGIDYWVRYVKGENDPFLIKECNKKDEYDKLLRHVKVYVNRIALSSEDMRTVGMVGTQGSKITDRLDDRNRGRCILEWKKECNGKFVAYYDIFADFADAKNFTLTEELISAKDIFIWDGKDQSNKIWIMKDGGDIDIEKTIEKNTIACRRFTWNQLWCLIQQTHEEL